MFKLIELIRNILSLGTRGLTDQERMIVEREQKAAREFMDLYEVAEGYYKAATLPVAEDYIIADMRRMGIGELRRQWERVNGILQFWRRYDA